MNASHLCIEVYVTIKSVSGLTGMVLHSQMVGGTVTIFGKK